MELALNLGMTCEQLERKMSGVEFYLWQRYASTRLLPMRRMELYLAQIAHTVATCVAGGDSQLKDFLFDEDLSDEGEEISAEEFFGYAPRIPDEGPQQGE